MNLINKIVIGLAFLPTLAFSADYAQVIVRCEVRVTEQDVFNKPETLPHALKINYLLSIDPKTKKFLRGRHDVVPSIRSTGGASAAILNNVGKKIKLNYYKGTLVNVKVEFGSQELSQMVLHAGSYRVEHKDIELTAISGNFKFGKWVKSQSHQETESDHGVSYHFWIKCESYYPKDYRSPILIPGHFVEDNYLKTISTSQDGWRRRPQNDDDSSDNSDNTDNSDD
ncbi:MAG: hypothetical protein HN509_13800 [Halobacteriovoraceae bacterium]|jgi:hypothetical protein|nr:hypothetical protein [Halobacteriovoraceae bacterium]MBT5093295.1 hypothetical protein [Halobacteriovoraceae bacterium]